MRIAKGAKIVVERWLCLKRDEHLLIITDNSHIQEAICLQEAAEKLGAFVVMLTVPESCPQLGNLFDTMLDFLLSNDVIIGATNYSLITTEAVKKVVASGRRYLSLPLSSTCGKSTLSFDFMTMQPDVSKAMAQRLLPYLNQAESLRVTTTRGTDLTVGKNGRTASYFAGVSSKPGEFASSSFEVYVAVEEDKTRGRAVLDGSLGYIGTPSEPTDLFFADGKLTEIEHNETGVLLQDYMDCFKDEKIYVVGEFGIGLNRKSKCVGNSYIEDESAYGTFHLGMGRNLSLGGVHDAKGHFDLVFCEPSIFAGDTLIMKEGKIIV